MTDLVSVPPIPAMTSKAIQKIVRLEDVLLKTPQFQVPMQHVLHAGMYARTVTLPANVIITGALVKIPTLLIVEGDTYVWLGEEGRRITGYAVVPAAANRKQAFRTVAETHLTMVFPTNARTVEEAEQEFTDEAARLASRRDDGINDTIITGEPACQE